MGGTEGTDGMDGSGLSTVDAEADEDSDVPRRACGFILLAQILEADCDLESSVCSS